MRNSSRGVFFFTNLGTCLNCSWASVVLPKIPIVTVKKGQESLGIIGLLAQFHRFKSTFLLLSDSLVLYHQINSNTNECKCKSKLHFIIEAPQLTKSKVKPQEPETENFEGF